MNKLMIKLTGEEYFILGFSRLKEGNSSEAEECFKEGANLYHSKCMLKLAKITQDESYYELAADFGEGEAIRWVIEKLIAEKNYEAALTKLDDYAVDSEDELRYETTFKMLDDKRTAGTISTDEMITLADLYERGKGTETNPQKAKELRDHVKFINTSSAAKAGDVESIFQLGKMYLHGEGTAKNITEAKSWFEKATKAGHVEAKTELYKIKLKSIAEIPDELERLKAYEEFLSSLDKAPGFIWEEATFELLRLKPESELDVEELHQLAGFYEEGLLCQKDKSMAIQLRILANFKETKAEADNGKPEAVYEIANRYLTGHGVEKNLYEAAKYVEKYSKLKPENYSKLSGLYRGLSQGFKEMAYRAKPPVEPPKPIRVDKWVEPSKPIRFDKWGVQI